MNNWNRQNEVLDMSEEDFKPLKLNNADDCRVFLDSIGEPSEGPDKDVLKRAAIIFEKIHESFTEMTGKPIKKLDA